MYLVLDCSQKDALLLKLITAQYSHDFVHAGRQADLLKAIHLFLLQEQVSISELLGVAAVTGEGSFTASRLAILCGNVFHFVLGVPVVAVNTTQILMYENLKEMFEHVSSGYALAHYTQLPNLG
jgi:tRNA A37 threonylcarbamoyladenosine modification protein TsaB